MQKFKEDFLSENWVCVDLLNSKMISHKNTDIDGFSVNYVNGATEFDTYFHRSIIYLIF